jgi:hypothetical protein
VFFGELQFESLPKANTYATFTKVTFIERSDKPLVLSLNTLSILKKKKTVSIRKISVLRASNESLEDSTLILNHDDQTRTSRTSVHEKWEADFLNSHAPIKREQELHEDSRRAQNSTQGSHQD